MEKFFRIFVFCFLGIGFFNQMFYGFCFSSRCLGYAFPKVLLMSVIVSAVIYVVTKNDSKAQ